MLGSIGIAEMVILAVLMFFAALVLMVVKFGGGSRRVTDGMLCFKSLAYPERSLKHRAVNVLT